MKDLLIRPAIFLLIACFLFSGCRKNSEAFSPQSNYSAASQQPVSKKLTATPFDGTVTLHVSVYYDYSGPGMVFVNWDAPDGYTDSWLVSVGGKGPFYTSTSDFSIQQHYSAGSTITATVTNRDNTISGTGSTIAGPYTVSPGDLHNPLPGFSSIEITNNLGGCTVAMNWAPQSNLEETAFYYLEIRSPDVSGPDGYWKNYTLAQGSALDGQKTISVNRYYYNDSVINARLVIQNQSFGDVVSKPPKLPYIYDNRFYLYFKLPWNYYHFKGTLNQFTDAYQVIYP